ncbi:MAG: 6-carboxytetrahydropterin synthase [Pseudomonadota bacterium]|nr:6-carboxytetrahydropterin synthase [Pseudomonadota bacterium]HJO36389.1 6-carboxytetrahydropterin synthase [Gammaproteobacteria bacterium]
MFELTVSDHVMIAHSFTGALFGPAQRLHGATYAVEVGFMTERLDAHGLIVDIGAAQQALAAALAPLAYQNLDELPQFAGRNTTTEVLAQYLAQSLAEAVRAGALGPSAPARVQRLAVTLRESPRAWARYEQVL